MRDMYSAIHCILRILIHCIVHPSAVSSWARAESCVSALDNNSYVLHARK
jgi:hypothetical protein